MYGLKFFKALVRYISVVTAKKLILHVSQICIRRDEDLYLFQKPQQLYEVVLNLVCFYTVNIYSPDLQFFVLTYTSTYPINVLTH